MLLQQGVAEQSAAHSTGLRDELRDVRAQLSDLAHENIDLQKQLHEFEVNEDTVGTADNTMDTATRLSMLSDEVRRLRGTLRDLSHENADLREQLLDLADTEEKSADDYYRDPGETLEAADQAAEEKSADDYYRDPGEDLDAADREMEMARAAADAGRLAAFTLRPHPHYADASPASAYSAEYVLGSLATGALYQWYARTCLFCPHDTFLLASFLGSGRTARLTNDRLRFDLDTLRAELRTRPLPPLVSGLAAN